MYQALYRKWRPKAFDDVVGQEHITQTLKRQIAGGRLSHAYLFVGTRGTGKTTCAKILSKAVNCTQPENGNPCNKCASCVGIDNGSILDVLELDAASNSGVDNFRALRDEAVFTPVNVKMRVYIVDEVHMLSTAAFNALLKILEEPPEHLMFILATTDIHKVPATILSRCQRFTFKRILPEIIEKRLRYVAGQEGLTLTDDAAALLARLSDGSLRDALSLLDQCAGEDVVDYDRVVSAIGLVGGIGTTGLLRAVAENDIAAALSLSDSFYLDGKTMASVLEELTQLIRDVLVTALMPKGGVGLISGTFDKSVLQDFTTRFSTEKLLSMLDILRDASLDLTKNAGGRIVIELCLMRLCDARLTGDMASVLSRLSRLEKKIESGLTLTPSAPAESISQPQKPQQPAADTPVVTPPETPPQPDSPQEKTAGQPEPEMTAPSDASKDEAIWKEILKLAKPKIDIPLHTFLDDPAQTCASFENGTLAIKAKNPFALNRINVPAVISALKGAAAEVMKKPVVVRASLEGGNGGASGSKLDALTDRFPDVVKVEE